MSAQRARPAIPADHRSAHPDFPGLPWWGAVLLALLCCTLGFAFDAGSGGGNLTKVFGSLYAIGCLAAVLAVRRSGLFTAIVQPPLILFAFVPAAYFLMHSSEIHGLKDLLINCGYPLIERFPLMLFTSAAVLAVGIARHYLGRSESSAPAAPKGATAAGLGLLAKLTAMVTSRLQPKAATEAPRRRRPDQRRTAAKSAPARARGERPTRRAAAPARSRHTRSPDVEPDDRPRRRRPRPADAPPEPRRRARPAGERRRRSAPPPDERERRYRERPERAERDRPQRPRPQRPSRYDGYDLFGGYDPAPPRSDGDHHPVSRVRYRGADDPPPRRRAPRDDADQWRYDI